MENLQKIDQPLNESDADIVYRRIKDYALETIIMTQKLQNLVFLTSELVSSLDHISSRPNSTNPKLLKLNS